MVQIVLKLENIFWDYQHIFIFHHGNAPTACVRLTDQWLEITFCIPCWLALGLLQPCKWCWPYLLNNQEHNLVFSYSAARLPCTRGIWRFFGNSILLLFFFSSRNWLIRFRLTSCLVTHFIISVLHLICRILWMHVCDSILHRQSENSLFNRGRCYYSRRSAQTHFMKSVQLPLI